MKKRVKKAAVLGLSAVMALSVTGGTTVFAEEDYSAELPSDHVGMG